MRKTGLVLTQQQRGTQLSSLVPLTAQLNGSCPVTDCVYSPLQRWRAEWVWVRSGYSFMIQRPVMCVVFFCFFFTHTRTVRKSSSTRSRSVFAGQRSAATASLVQAQSGHLQPLLRNCAWCFDSSPRATLRLYSAHPLSDTEVPYFPSLQPVLKKIQGVIISGREEVLLSFTRVKVAIPQCRYTLFRAEVMHSNLY